MKFEAFAHNISPLWGCLDILKRLDLMPVEYRYFPQQHKLLLIYTDFLRFHSFLRQSEIKATPAFSKQCLIVRNAWCQRDSIMELASERMDPSLLECVTTQFGTNLLIYVIKGNVKKALSIFEQFCDVSINSQFYEQEKDLVYVIKHDFAETEDANE